eukprot:TRINITY_DN3116_c0_g1_i1.p1 TRINITY_DN3116_c0_g1~~TRINITY_DN3116_c0_g1_i1.p1  ORF type:complete len:369 (-),score=70.77 TRINITY_DN3116_c0_g1_i1:210-1202(-)
MDCLDSSRSSVFRAAQWPPREASPLPLTRRCGFLGSRPRFVPSTAMALRRPTYGPDNAECLKCYSVLGRKTWDSEIGLASAFRLSPIERTGGRRVCSRSSRLTRYVPSVGGSGPVYVVASLLGVGAPEALVVAVVALLVFGPKGLAEVARNIGKTLKTFQPTIRELQEVSREFKSALEEEMGLEELRNPTNVTKPPPSPTPLPSTLPTNVSPAAPAVSPPPAFSAAVAATTPTAHPSSSATDPAATAASAPLPPATATSDTVVASTPAASSTPKEEKAYTAEEFAAITELQMKALKGTAAAEELLTRPAASASESVAGAPKTPSEGKAAA